MLVEHVSAGGSRAALEELGGALNEALAQDAVVSRTIPPASPESALDCMLLPDDPAMRMAELQFQKEFASRLFPLEFRSKMALALFERLFAERRQSRQLSRSRPAGHCRISFPLMLIFLDELRWIAAALFLEERVVGYSAVA